MDESMDKYLKNNSQELSTLPDCGNCLQKQRDNHKFKAPLQGSNSSDDDTDSEGSMTPLLIWITLHLLCWVDGIKFNVTIIILNDDL